MYPEIDEGTMPQSNLNSSDMKNGGDSFSLGDLHSSHKPHGEQAPGEPHTPKVFTIHLDGPPQPHASPPAAHQPAAHILGRPRPSVDSHYDPHLHREIDAPTTNAETLIHLLKGSLGTGILAMPHAFKNSGWVVGLIGTILIGSLCTYCMHILIRTQYEMCRRLRVPVLTYPRTMEYALETGPRIFRGAMPYSGAIINTFLIVYQLGICCVYIVFVATNLKEVLDYYWMEINLRLVMLMILLPLILLNFIRNLKLLAPFSTLANIITFVGLGIIMYYLFTDIESPLERPLAGHVTNYPLFIGTTLFALEAVGVIIALENNMQTPFDFRGYTGVLNRGMSLIVFLYALVGFVGFLRYGDDVKGSITLNLPNTKLAESVKIMFCIAIFITYALQCYVPVDIIWTFYMKERLEKASFKIQIFWEYVLRTGIVLVTFLLAVAIPNLELFISLFGALCLSALGIAFPAFIEICLLWPRQAYGPYKWILVKDIILFIFGIFALVVGTYTSVLEIVHSFL